MKLILITGNPGDGKTITARAIRDALLAEGKNAYCLNTDEFYMKYIKENREYMYGEEIHKNLKWHYERMNEEVKKGYEHRVKDSIEWSNNDYYIIEGWHLQEILGRIMVQNFKHDITLIVMSLNYNQARVNGKKIPRDMEIVKYVLDSLEKNVHG